MKIYIQNNKLFIKHKIDNQEYKFSTELENTIKNRAWLRKNLQKKFNQLLKLHKTKIIINKTSINKPTLNQFALESFEMNKNYRREHTTKDLINKYNLHIKPLLGDKKIDEISIKDIKQWQNYLIEINLSVKYIKNLRSILNVILKDALEDEIIEKNPIEKVKAPKRKYSENKYQIEPFTKEEIELLINNATGQFKNILITLFFTGIRLGELVALKWNDINWEKKTITIKRANQKDGSIGFTKTEKNREITLLPPVEKALKNQKQINEYIFTTQYNKRYINYNTLRDYHWRKLLKKCNLEYRELYQTRHTFASMMISNNENITWVSNMLGHSEITTTLRFYTKYIPQEKITKASFLNNFNI